MTCNVVPSPGTIRYPSSCIAGSNARWCCEIMSFAWVDSASRSSRINTETPFPCLSPKARLKSSAKSLSSACSSGETIRPESPIEITRTAVHSRTAGTICRSAQVGAGVCAIASRPGHNTANNQIEIRRRIIPFSFVLEFGCKANASVPGFTRFSPRLAGGRWGLALQSTHAGDRRDSRSICSAYRRCQPQAAGRFGMPQRRD